MIWALLKFEASRFQNNREKYQKRWFRARSSAFLAFAFSSDISWWQNKKNNITIVIITPTYNVHYYVECLSCWFKQYFPCFATRSPSFANRRSRPRARGRARHRRSSPSAIKARCYQNNRKKIPKVRVVSAPGPAPFRFNLFGHFTINIIISVVYNKILRYYYIPRYKFIAPTSLFASVTAKCCETLQTNVRRTSVLDVLRAPFVVNDRPMESLDALNLRANECSFLEIALADVRRYVETFAPENEKSVGSLNKIIKPRYSSGCKYE